MGTQKIKKVAYIAHPISGNVEENKEKVIQIVRHLNLLHKRIIPFAPYIVDLIALDDNREEERKRGIRNNIYYFESEFVDELWLYGDYISLGMQEEINLAWSNGIIVRPQTNGTIKQLKLLEK